MIISDLQYIEFATENEVQASGGRWRPPHNPCNPKVGFELEVLCTDPETPTSTDTVIIEG